MRDRRIQPDTIVGGVVVAFAAVYLALARQIPPSSFTTAVIGPSAFPNMIGVGMAVAGIALIVTSLRSRPGAASGKSELELEIEAAQEDVPPQDAARLTIVLLLLLAYVFLFVPLGYMLSTGLFILSTTTFLDRRHWLRNVLYAVLFPLLVYLLFTRLLQVTLPPGLLG